MQSLNLRSIWQASDSLSPRAPGSAHQPFLKFAQNQLSTPWLTSWHRNIWHLVTHRVGYEEAIFAEREDQLVRRTHRTTTKSRPRPGFTLVNPRPAATSGAKLLSSTPNGGPY